MAEASDFKFGTPLGFAKAIIKPHPEEKWAWPWVMEAPIYLGFPFNISRPETHFGVVSHCTCSSRLLLVT